jgi:hypothetical protein
MTSSGALQEFQLKADAQTFLKGLTADVQRGDYVDPVRRPRRSGQSLNSGFLASKGRLRSPDTCRLPLLLDTIVLPQWGDSPLKSIDYTNGIPTWLGMLARRLADR